MALEDVPSGVASDGNGLVLFVPTIANPGEPTVAELDAGTPLTYSLTGDGFAHTTTENRVIANRLTLKQQIQYAGTVTDEVELSYANGSTAETTLAEGTAGYIVARWGVPNEDPIAAADVVTVIPGSAGVQRQNPPATNAELTKSQTWLVQGTVQRDVAVAAGV